MSVEGAWLPQLVTEIFAAIDLDHDGSISKVELMSHMMRSGLTFPEAQPAESDAELKAHCDAVFAELDTDASGGLSSEKLATGLSKYVAKHGDGAKETLRLQMSAGDYSMYFGFGSNMSPEGMASKGLSPLRSYRAILKDYKLCFNLRFPGLCDPSFANIEACPGAEAHGVCIAFSAADMKKLDQYEATYERMTVPVQAYAEDGGAAYLAEAYIVTPAILDSKPWAKEVGVSLQEVPPSQRYLNMLTSGGAKMRLDPAYLAALEKHPVSSLPAIADHLTDDAKAKISARRYSMEEVEASMSGEEGVEVITVLKGVVFTCPKMLIANVGGKDATLSEALRVRVIDSMDEADDEHKTWINARLAEQLYFCTVLPGLAVIGQTNYDEYTW